MLMSAGLPLPRHVFAHGYWTLGGQKISKSRGAAMPRPGSLLDSISAETGCERERAVDALRYHMLREVPFGQDGEFSLEALLGRYADDLANDLGNLLHRVLPMIARYRAGRIPAPCAPDPDVHPAAQRAVAAWEQAAETLDFRAGLEAIWGFLATANRYVDRTAPWSLARNGDDGALDRVLYAAAEAIRIASVLIAPVMPNAADEIERQLGYLETQRTWEQAGQWGLLPGGQQIGERRPLFPRQDPEKLRQEAAEAAPSVSGPGQERTMISFKQFQALDLRVGEIVSAEPVPNTDKLLKLTVNIGDEQRTMVAGIALSYSPDDLIGKQVVVVANLEPATIRGVRSEGMILAGWVEGDDKSVTLVTPARPLPNGARVT
jgi:methionyl-tRNA synthetase